MQSKVNSWTEWAKLKTIVVGKADHAAFNPEEPAFKGRINNDIISKELNWPRGGPKKKEVVDAANKQLDNLAKILEDLGVKVLRPDCIDFTKTLQTPLWTIESMFCCVCPRDVVITIGNTVIEATMSKRSRFFEYLPYRRILNNLWEKDAGMNWKAAPKPSMSDDMYWVEYWDKFNDFEKKSETEKQRLLYDYKYVLVEQTCQYIAFV